MCCGTSLEASHDDQCKCNQAVVVEAAAAVFFWQWNDCGRLQARWDDDGFRHGMC